MELQITVHSYGSWLQWVVKEPFSSVFKRAKAGLRASSRESRDSLDGEDTLVGEEHEERKASVTSTATAVNGTAEVASISAKPDDSTFKSDFDRIVSFFKDAYVEVNGAQWDDDDLWDKLDEKVSLLYGIYLSP